jgi:hypothetical protein
VRVLCFELFLEEQLIDVVSLKEFSFIYTAAVYFLINTVDK